MRRSTFLSLALFPLAMIGIASACIHAPEDYEGSIGQTKQTAFVFWDAGVEDLVIKPAYRAEGKAPTSLAWVIPVPNDPIDYGEVDPDMFKGLSRVLGQSFAPKSIRRNRAGGIKLLKPAVVGNYRIQPIKATGPGGAKALNGWLTKNGFGAVPEANMKYYVERDWVWLCVKAETEAASGELKPLRITFKSEKIVYPLKFSTHQGRFRLKLIVVTKKSPGDFKRMREQTGLSQMRDESKLPDWASEVPQGSKLSGKVWLTLIEGMLSGEKIAKWKDDLSLEPSK